MVRHKTRHFLVRLDFEKDLRRKTASSRRDAAEALTTKGIFQCIRDTTLSSFGVSMSGITNEIQVRLYDEKYQLVFLRVPRAGSSRIRAAMSLIMSIDGRRVVLSTISVHGSARTAKRAAVLEYKRRFREELTMDGCNTANDSTMLDAKVQWLNDKLTAIRKMD